MGREPGGRHRRQALRTVPRVHEGQPEFDGKPRILHPQWNELDSVCHTNLGKIMGSRQIWFDWLGNACKLENVLSGKVYVGEEEKDQSLGRQTATVTGFKELDGLAASGHCEYYCVPGVLVKDELGNEVFVKRSFGNCIAHLKDPHLLAELPNPHRILTVPFPFLDPKGKKLIYPGAGYDERFHTYMIEGAPTIDFSMTVKRERRRSSRTFTRSSVSGTRKARFTLLRGSITPFARGLLGFTTRVPLWIFRANRPRAGKDYLAVMTILVYEGIAAEDSPIDRQSEETGKRIMSAARNGRRFMHFSNCTGTLKDIHLTQAVTNERITARRLGSNEATSDLSVPNTMEFSLSGNMELNYSEDIDERSRQIFLAFFEEEANGRKFKNPFLHRNVREHRGEVLSAIATLFREWEREGMPLGKEVFTTYPAWAEIIGGVMAVNGLGDPCQPFKDDRFNVSGDRRTEAMAALYEVCHGLHGEVWIKKDDIYSTVHNATQETEEHSGVEALEYFGILKDNEKAHSNRSRLGRILQQYNFRILDGIQMRIDVNSANGNRNLYRFIKQRDGAPEPVASENQSDKPKTPENGPKTCKDVRFVRFSDVTHAYAGKILPKKMKRKV